MFGLSVQTFFSSSVFWFVSTTTIETNDNHNSMLQISESPIICVEFFLVFFDMPFRHTASSSTSHNVSITSRKTYRLQLHRNKCLCRNCQEFLFLFFEIVFFFATHCEGQAKVPQVRIVQTKSFETCGVSSAYL